MTNNGTCEARLYCQGYDIVLGIPLGAVLGNTLEAKRHAISQCTVDDLDGLMKDGHGWLLKMDHGSEEIFMIPSGHLIISSFHDASYVRWGRVR